MQLQKMLAGEVDLTNVIIGSDFEDYAVFLEAIGNFDRESRIFTATDPGTQVNLLDLFVVYREN